MTATEEQKLLGFVVLIPYKNMVMVDYLAVSSKIRSKGTGSYIMENVCRQYADKKIVLLIECLDDQADNREQRIFLLYTSKISAIRISVAHRRSRFTTL